MTTEKHTVTVPISDYNEMKDALNRIKGFNENWHKHMDMMGNYVSFDGLQPDKYPTRVRCYPDMINQKMTVQFSYD